VCAGLETEAVTSAALYGVQCVHVFLRGDALRVIHDYLSDQRAQWVARTSA